MNDTTSISELPQNNVTMETKELPNKNPPAIVPNAAPGNSSHLSASTINKIVSGIQEASATNMTQLPSRDIPMHTHQHAQDLQTQPNYIPPTAQNDYIHQHDSYQTIMQKNVVKERQKDKLDVIYNEIQTPMFAMVLYLLFQLPALQKTLLRQLPSLFNSDGNIHLSGYLFKTLLFGTSFYLIQKGTQYLSEL